ncbi:MAG: hypothetical protein FWD54_04780 [Endomicrobia bacterium]|nr:hypothetical protein [Endomicrobiia bacterium]
MYNINLIGRNIVRLKKTVRIVNVFKLFSLLLTFVLLGVFALSVMTFLKKDDATGKIEKLKMNIDEERRLNKVKSIESEWEANYYRLLAVRDIITNRTQAGLLLRDIGLYIPEGYRIVRFELTPDKIIKMSVQVKGLKRDRFQLNTTEEELKNFFSRSDLIGEPVEITVPKDSMKVKGRAVDVINVTVPLKGVQIIKKDAEKKPANKKEGETPENI